MFTAFQRIGQRIGSYLRLNERSGSNINLESRNRVKQTALCCALFPCFFIISKRKIFYFNPKSAWYKIQLNRPFPSSPGPLYQNEFRCSTFDMEMIFHCHVNKTHFHKKGCAPNLVLIQSPWGTRKWPIYTRQWLPST